MRSNTQSQRFHPGGRTVPGYVGEQERRLAILKHSGLFGACTDGTEVGRAISLDDLRGALRLVYSVFLDAGYITPNVWGMRVRSFDAIADNATFIAKRDNQVVGVMGLVLDSPGLGLPSDGAFRAELDSMRAGGLRLGEATNQAILPQFRRTSVATELMRCGYAQSMLHHVDESVVSVSPSHRRFYEMMGFRRVTGVRSYSSSRNDPVILMSLRFDPDRRLGGSLDACERFILNFLWKDNPYKQEAGVWQSMANNRLYDANLLRSLFVEESDLFGVCTDAERRAVRRCWGHDLFAEVFGARAAGLEIPASSYVSEKAPVAGTVQARSDQYRNSR